MLISLIRSVLLYLILIAVIRLMGKRQIGQMEAPEFVVTMLIADLASVPMQNNGISLFSGLIPILAVLALELILAGSSMRWLGVRRVLCGKPVIENAKAFGCAAWREGCRFTLWKDALRRGGGPALTEKLTALLLEKKEVKGSTGVIALRDGQLLFIPNGAETPSVQTPIIYQKK